MYSMLKHDEQSHAVPLCIMHSINVCVARTPHFLLFVAYIMYAIKESEPDLVSQLLSRLYGQ
jgi:hypothetical protein